MKSSSMQEQSHLGPAFSVEEKKKDCSRRAKDLLQFVLSVRFRIAGDTALNKNIHESVSAQIRKNFAKSKWRVSDLSSGMTDT